jgi:putative resolvase
VNLTEWAHAQGIHVTTAYRWWREGTLPVPARKVGRLILVSPDTAAGPSRQDAAGLYARVSSHDQKADLDRQVARLSAWAAQAGLPVVRIEAEVGSGMSASVRYRRRATSRGWATEPIGPPGSPSVPRVEPRPSGARVETADR